MVWIEHSSYSSEIISNMVSEKFYYEARLVCEFYYYSQHTVHMAQPCHQYETCVSNQQHIKNRKLKHKIIMKNIKIHGIHSWF